MPAVPFRTQVAGFYRARFAAAVAARAYDYYLVLEDDLLIGATQLSALCRASKSFEGTPLIAGLMRYEHVQQQPTTAGHSNSTQTRLTRSAEPQANLFLTDDPAATAKVQVGSDWYLLPSVPYSGGWFLPADRLSMALDELQEHGVDWLARQYGIYACCRWLRDIGSEVYSGLWLTPFFTVALPLAPHAFDQHLVHHLSDRYALENLRHHPSATAYLAHAQHRTREIALEVLRNRSHSAFLRNQP